MAEPQRCSRCILPTSFPGLQLDEQGVCQYCRAESVEEAEATRLDLARRVDEAIANRQRGAVYDVIVAYSGGKDSTYTLLRLTREYGLRCLAVTIDNGFLAAGAMTNIAAVTDSLGVDHILYKPSFQFMRKVYAESMQGGLHAPAAIRRASDICSSCINLINTYMIKVAVQHGVSLIAGGYIGGQVPKDSAVLDLDLDMLRRTRAVALEKLRLRLGDDAMRHYSLPETNGKLTAINPLLAITYGEERMIAEIGELGWKPPADTGRHSSNCLLNDLGIHVHHKRYGFHPYAFELAELVRKGFMDRDAAIARIEAVPDASDVLPALTKLGLE